MKTELDTLIEKAYKSEGATADVNKVYLELLKTEVFIPAEIHEITDPEEEPYTPLFLVEAEQIFMTAFDSGDKLEHWAGDSLADLDFVTMKGKDMISAMGEPVALALNPGTEL